MILKRDKNRCLRRCDSCGSEDWLNDYWAVTRRERHICHRCANVETGLQKRGIPNYKRRGRRKKDSEYEIGSTYTDSDGHVLVYVGRESFDSHRGGYYRLHRLMMEYKLKRRLTVIEIVHHVDLNPQNNEDTNLYLCPDMSEHRLLHSQLARIAGDLVSMGIVRFNRRKKIYQIVDKYRKEEEGMSPTSPNVQRIRHMVDVRKTL